MNIHEVLDYGPIVFTNEKHDVLITINGSYLNVWVGQGGGQYDNTACRSGHDDLYTLTVSEAMDLAKEWFEEVLMESRT